MSKQFGKYAVKMFSYLFNTKTITHNVHMHNTHQFHKSYMSHSLHPHNHTKTSTAFKTT